MSEKAIKWFKKSFRPPKSKFSGEMTTAKWPDNSAKIEAFEKALGIIEAYQSNWGGAYNDVKQEIKLLREIS